MQSKYYIGAIIIGCVLTSALCLAYVGIRSEGMWPDTWPKELDPLRKQAQTVDVMHGIQENVYVIPFRKQANFEKAWPHILKIKSKGAPLILEKSPFMYNVSGSECASGIMILAPSLGIIGGPYSPRAETYQQAEVFFEEGKMEALVKEGKMLRASPPWPVEIMSDEGELPEYVSFEQDVDGKMRWVDAKQFNGKRPKTRYRARIEIILITDGKIVDLNRIRLPENTPIIDNRFK